MLERNALAVGLVLLSFSQLTTIAADFRHELKGDVKPWTNEAFPDDHQEFHFAIVSDRTGGERKGFFEKGIDSINLLRPEFVMSVGANTADEIAAAKRKLVSMVRAAVPAAEVRVLGEKR